MDELTPVTALLLSLAPVEYRETVARLLPEQRRRVSDELNSVIQKLTLLSVYVERANNAHGPSDDKTHAMAVKSANRALAEVRAALGYSYSNAAEVRF